MATAGFADHAVIARADLTDRNGELLARDLPVKDLYARPHVFWDKAQAARDLAAATGADEAPAAAPASTMPSIPMCWWRARSRPTPKPR